MGACNPPELCRPSSSTPATQDRRSSRTPNWPAATATQSRGGMCQIFHALLKIPS